MNKDRFHAQELARKHNVRFLPVYVYLSNENVWKERVTNRFDEMKHPEIATWERIQHQRQRFREWEPGTALFVDSLNPFEQNYQKVLDFVTGADVNLKPLENLPLETGKYH
jgi:predicted kinase